MALLKSYETEMFTISRLFGSDALAHVQIGLAIWIISAIVTRLPLSDGRPLAVLAVVEATNEILDRLAKGSWQWPDTRADVLHSLAWPTILYVALKLVPRLRK